MKAKALVAYIDSLSTEEYCRLLTTVAVHAAYETHRLASPSKNELENGWRELINDAMDMIRKEKS